MSQGRHIRIALSALLLVLGSCAAPSGSGKAPTGSDNEIVIGVVGPMSGDFDVFGEQLRRGAQMAVKDINHAGGVLGKQLRLVIGDDQCDPPHAARVANYMVKQGAVFIDGHFCSGSSIPASAVYHEAGILQITPASTNPVLTDNAAAKGWATLFRTTGRDDFQGDVAGAWLARHYAGRSVAVIDDGSPYGRGIVQHLIPAMAKAGVQASLTANYYTEASNYDDLIAKLAAKEPAAIYVGGYHRDFGKIVRSARKAGLTADFFGGDDLNASEFWSIAGSAGEGVRFTDAASEMDLPSAKATVAAFRSDGYEPEGYVLNSYAAVQAWAAAAAEAGTTDAEKVAHALHAGTFPTVIGDLSWDAKGDLTNTDYAWFVWHDGGFAREPMD